LRERQIVFGNCIERRRVRLRLYAGRRRREVNHGSADFNIQATALTP
jgi:hypothetical protein